MAIAYTKAEIHAEVVGKFKNDYISYPFILDVWLDDPDLDAPCPNCGAAAWEVLEVEGHTEDDRDIECWVNATCCDVIGDTFDSEYFGWEGIEWSWLINETKVGKLWGEAFSGRKVYYDEEADHGYGSWNVDWGLTVEKWTPDCDLRQKDIKEFISRNHRHNAAPVQWKWAHLIWNGPDLIAVVWTGRPVARRIDHSTTVEVNRLCIDHSLNRALTWKASSVGYKASALEAKSRGYKSIITYTLAEAESGLSLRYARWKKDGPPSKGGSWNRAGRPREDKAPTVPKQRWIKRLDA
jgi:hypothetical protein